MAIVAKRDGVVRVPNLPMGNMTTDDGFPSAEEMNFRQTLITSLQLNFGAEGLVMPSQTTANIALIAANFYLDPISGATVYTCQAGTMIYDTDTDQVKAAILVAGVPTFKVVTVT